MERKMTLKSFLVLLACTLAFACQKSSELEENSPTNASVKKSMLASNGVTTNGVDNTIRIIANVRTQVPSFKESNSSFECPANTVLTGRYHSGDENGQTAYEYATLKAIDSNGNLVGGTITVEDERWEVSFSESSGAGFTAPTGRTIVGRRHSGDENGQTAYKTAVIKYNGLPTTTNNPGTTGDVRESSIGWFTMSEFRLMTGRHHNGDENGNTNYSGATFIYDPNATIPQPPSGLPYRIVVKLFSAETYYPMDPIDFIHVSRFRENVENGADNGWSKAAGGFVQSSNSHNYPDNYDIPVSIINSYYSPLPLYNVRPRDDMKDPNLHGVFLEPDDNLIGNTNPNSTVPVFSYANYYGTSVQYWLFYGYDNGEISAGVGPSHQGDWENIIVNLTGTTVVSVTLSQHTGSTTYPASDVVTMVDGIPTITVYSAYGTHAMYGAPGIYNHGIDHCDDGYAWAITNYIQDLSTEPWKDYAGAWGEVGLIKESTGPLGPWYKKINYDAPTVIRPVRP